MTAYLLARATIVDRAKFQDDFMPVIKQALQDFDGKLLAQSDNPATVHGDATSIIGNIQHLAILEFEDIATAHACTQSAEFKRAMEIAGTCLQDHYVRMIEGLSEMKSEPAPAHEHSAEPAAE